MAPANQESVLMLNAGTMQSAEQMDGLELITATAQAVSQMYGTLTEHIHATMQEQAHHHVLIQIMAS